MNPLQDPAQDLELRITEEDMKVIRTTFKDNKALFKVLLKIFLPTAADPEMPVDYREDLWNKIDYKSMRVEDVKSVVVARQDLINWVRDCLVMIKGISNTTEETIEQIKEKVKKDSNI